MLTIKKQNLNLDAFLLSVINPLNKEINKHFRINLDNTNNINNLYNFFNSNPNKIYLKLYIFPYKNKTILNIIFKFTAKYNIQLIYDCFYISKRK
jgi:hypothetical protein